MSALQILQSATIKLKRGVRKLIGSVVRLSQGVWNRSRPEGGDGLEGAKNVVPIRPLPPHHLAGAKAFPPSNVTHCYGVD